MDWDKTMQTIVDVGIQVGFKVVAAIIFYLVGRWLISFAIRLVSTALERQKVDPTLLRYITKPSARPAAPPAIRCPNNISSSAIRRGRDPGLFRRRDHELRRHPRRRRRRHRPGLERLIGEFRRRRVHDRAPAL